MKRFMVVLSAGALLLLVMSVVNQTAQVVSLASSLSPLAGEATAVVLLTGYCLLGVMAGFAFLRLRAPLTPPADGTPEHEAFLRQLGERLSRNPHLEGMPCKQRNEIEAAIHKLDARSEDVIHRSARAVFVSTAISQNGRLDALMVLVSQVR